MDRRDAAQTIACDSDNKCSTGYKRRPASVKDQNSQKAFGS